MESMDNALIDIDRDRVQFLRAFHQYRDPMDRSGVLWVIHGRQRAEMVLVALQCLRLFLGHAVRHPVFPHAAFFHANPVLLGCLPNHLGPVYGGLLHRKFADPYGRHRGAQKFLQNRTALGVLATHPRGRSGRNA